MADWDRYTPLAKASESVTRVVPSIKIWPEPASTVTAPESFEKPTPKALRMLVSVTTPSKLCPLMVMSPPSDSMLVLPPNSTPIGKFPLAPVAYPEPSAPPANTMSPPFESNWVLPFPLLLRSIRPPPVLSESEKKWMLPPLAWPSAPVVTEKLPDPRARMVLPANTVMLALSPAATRSTPSLIRTTSAASMVIPPSTLRSASISTKELAIRVRLLLPV